MIAPAVSPVAVLLLLFVVFVVAPWTLIGLARMLWQFVHGYGPSRGMVLFVLAPALFVGAIVAAMAVSIRVHQIRQDRTIAAAASDVEAAVVLLGFEDRFELAVAHIDRFGDECGRARAEPISIGASPFDDAAETLLAHAAAFEARGYEAVVASAPPDFTPSARPERDFVLIAAKAGSRTVEVAWSPGWRDEFGLPWWFEERERPEERDGWFEVEVGGCGDVVEPGSLEDLVALRGLGLVSET